MDAVLGALLYVVNAPYFWLSTGMTISVAMFVGAIIFDGKLPMVTKALISTGLYACFLLQISFTRITHVFSTQNVPLERQTMAYAGIATILIVTILWGIGMYFGVLICQQVRKKHHSLEE